MRVTIETLTGEHIVPVLPDLARLRIAVFREWPYLYDGDVAYEERYLQFYVRSPGAAIIVARDGGTVIGAATCLPLRDEQAPIRAPFEARGLDLDDFFYFGESVLLGAYRGQGLGVRFFAEREHHALATSPARFATFCSVRRPDDHPARPPGATTLHGFWARRGFRPLPGVTCVLDWKEPGQTDETPHLLDFFIKPIRGAPIPASLETQEHAP
ncbi:GNAT family N-acetyltransferase [Gluconacetobacter sacchari]|uniref:GNAT family N-acetyltransferase n=2 Tax=Gluconacetobacter sacchari TaxID=92759 RepID=A0A7W4IFN6_9PROT|nr:GNAT family N-acetyltransferase [Gluconacetobacter sacchari]MBB2162018.1 GNAT family N-acetyltransferase [Gluconacetobacter sacchari]GBQ27992.1 acetyltransferase [Gluconacetobacter sacchari DSM 12717]